MMKNLAIRLLGERNIGRLQFLLKPGLANRFGGPLNGQAHRRRMFSDIMASIPFQAIVETGTFRGTTTAFFGDWGLPVYSVEINPRNAGFSSLHLFRQRRRIHLFESDSPSFLKELASREQFPKARVFFYLDAHWEEHLPLGEELEIIFANWREAVVMVDDFKVPGSTYAYDDYGPGKVLSLEYLDRYQHLKLIPFFPSVAAEFETGLRRGSVVLCREASVADPLRRIESLTAASDR
jgi:hypothetical protein